MKVCFRTIRCLTHMKVFSCVKNVKHITVKFGLMENHTGNNKRRSRFMENFLFLLGSRELVCFHYPTGSLLKQKCDMAVYYYYYCVGDGIFSTEVKKCSSSSDSMYSMLCDEGWYGNFFKKRTLQQLPTPPYFLTSHGGAELCTYRADISTFTWFTPLKVGWPIEFMK